MALSDLRPVERAGGARAVPRGIAVPVAAPGGPETLEVTAIRDDVVRIRVSRGGAFDPRPSHAVVAPLDGPVDVTTDIGPTAAVLSTRVLVVRVELGRLRMTVHRTDGSLVLATGDKAPGTYATLNDAWATTRELDPADQVYGLGERTGPGNRRGRVATMWNLDVLDPHRTAEFTAGHPDGDPRGDRHSTAFDPYYVAVPFWTHRRAATGAVAGFFLDNPYRGSFDLTDRLTISYDGGQWCEYVLAGPAMAQVLEAYTWLTGRMPLPPLWALGHHQCRWHRDTQDGVVAIADRMSAEDIPCDAYWLDIEHMRGYRVFTWDEATFADPSALVADLAEHGAQLLTIVDPGLKADPDWPVFTDARDRDTLCRTEGGGLYLGQVWPGDTAFPDFATPQTRAWWGGLNAAHVARGVAGIWNDMNEPATGDVAPDRMRFDHGRASHERYHNQYALLMAEATTAGLRAARPDLRTFVLSRAGFAGIQRHAATWTGDNIASWEFLAQSIPMSTGLGMSGQPFVGSDIGGFLGEPTPELFVRWMQYGMLTPFARNHEAIDQADRYPWSFGPEVLARVRDAIRLRYRLMPAIYAAFVEASETGLPVQRPLVLADQGDPGLAEVDDAYLLGSHLLVAPVLEPGVTEREVQLPAGHWWDWHLGGWHCGRTVVATPPEHVGLLVRAGAVIPTWPDVPRSTATRPEQVELHLVVPRDGPVVSVLQEDDGLTTAAQDGARWRTTFTVEGGETVRMVATVEGAGYPEHRRTTFRLVVHGMAPTTVRCDGRPVARDDRGWLLEVGTAPFVVDLG